MKRKCTTIIVLLLVYVISGIILPITLGNINYTGNKTNNKMDQYRNATVLLVNKESYVNGFVVSNDGYVITAGHISSSKSLKIGEIVKVYNTRPSYKSTARLCKNYIPEYDVAIFKIEDYSGKILILEEDDNKYIPGNSCIIPSIKYKNDELLFKCNIVGYHKVYDFFEFGFPVLYSMISIDMPLYKGTSGSPLIDLETGNVIGMYTFSDETEHWSYCIPSNLISKLFKEFLKNENKTK